MKCKYYRRFIIEFAGGGGGDFRCKFDKFEFARVNGRRGCPGPRMRYIHCIIHVVNTLKKEEDNMNIRFKRVKL